MALADAFEYATRGAAQVVVGVCDGAVVHAFAAPEWNDHRVHALYSGTKAFWGPLAIVAQRDGLMQLDEPVADTFAVWRDDAYKARVTLRMLLQLTAASRQVASAAACPRTNEPLR